MRIKATEMVGVRLTTHEVQWLLDALAEGKLGSVEADPELQALQRKLTVMRQVAAAAEARLGRSER